MSELDTKISGLAERVLDYKNSQAQAMSDLNNRVDHIEAGLNRSKFGGGGAGGHKDHQEVEAMGRFIRSRGQIQAGMSSDSDPNGGFTVYPAVANEIGQILRDVSPMRQRTEIVTFEEGDSFEETFAVDAAIASWVGERESRPETAAPDLKQSTIPAREIYASPMVTQRLVDDGKYDIVKWLEMQVAQGFAEKEGTAFINGDGVLSPRGLLTYSTDATDDDTRAWETLQHVVTGAASGFAATDPGDALVDLMMSLKAGYRPNAAWLMNRKTAGTIRKFKDGQSNYLWETSYQAGQPDQLLGFPVYLDENMPDVAANAYPVAFGDFMPGYRIVEKPGMRILIDPYTQKPNLTVYIYARVGGAVRDFNAIKLLKVST